MQLKNDGNTEGELSNQPGVPSVYGDYPEVFTASRHFPTGRVNDFQRSKIRLWTIYTLGLGKYRRRRSDRPLALQHRPDLQPGRTGEPLSDLQYEIAAAAGYQNAPDGGEQDIFFGKLGSGTFPGYGVGDFGINYSIPVWRTMKPYLKLGSAERIQQPEEDWRSTRPCSPTGTDRLTTLGIPLNYIEGPALRRSDGGRPTIPRGGRA